MQFIRDYWCYKFAYIDINIVGKYIDIYCT